MKTNSEKSTAWANIFSHVYIEAGAENLPAAKRILARLPNAARVPFGNRRDIFFRRGQDYLAQKNSPKLILAVQDEFLRDGSGMCDDFGHERFLIASQMMNCLYDCEYCYLQGAHPSANVVAFVNTPDYFAAVREYFGNMGQDAYLCLSYDADLLALEGLTGFIREWLEFCAGEPRLTLEIRTKCGVFPFGTETAPLENVIFAWTLSPENVIRKFERRAPGLEDRISAAKKASSNGWRVRLCIDPVIAARGWEADYAELARAVAAGFPHGTTEGLSVGAFRAREDVFEKMKKMRPYSEILAGDFVKTEGRGGQKEYRYRDEEEIELVVKGACEGYD
ncbi:MAG: radical SAM protein [Defluviitaleaceae bacterium]|nr:radical SAM protein [Defluviitaleaceae bacterium]